MILTLQRKIDNLKLRMPNVVARCEPGMVEAEGAEKAEDVEDAAPVNNEAVEVENQSVISAQSASVGEAEVHEAEEKTASEPQKNVISEKTVTIDEQMAKVSQMAEQSVVGEEAVEDAMDPTEE